MITKEQAIDILDKFDFFQGQRAGRELWNDKPFEVQEQDIKNFSNDVALLKEYISYVVPKSEAEKLKADVEVWRQNRFNIFQRLECYEMARQEVAREIFEEIDVLVDDWKHSYIQSIQFIAELAELKKKYTENKE